MICNTDHDYAAVRFWKRCLNRAADTLTKNSMFSLGYAKIE